MMKTTLRVLWIQVMRRCLAALVPLLSLLMLSSSAQEQLVWSEEFRSTGRLDPNVWSYDVGGGGYGNAEMQSYETENVQVEGGKLVITVKEEESSWNGRSFTSGRIRSNGKVEFQYGIVEAKMKVPNVGDGLWPAFWMLGTTYPETQSPLSGQIDIMELGSARALGLEQPTTRVGSGVHWGAFGHNQYDYNEVTTEFDMTDDYHIYKLEWTPDEIVTWVDDVRIFEKSISPDDCYECEELHQPFFLVLNLAVGGGYSHIYHEDEITADIPAEMLVDYIRIYDNGYTELSGTALETPSSTSTTPSAVATDTPTGSPTSEVPTVSPASVPTPTTEVPSPQPTTSNRDDESSLTESPTRAPAEDETPTHVPTTVPPPPKTANPTTPPRPSNLPVQHLEAIGIRMDLTNMEPLDPRTADMWADVTRDFLATQTIMSIGSNLVDNADVSVSLVSQNPPFLTRNLLQIRATQQETTQELTFDAIFDIQSIVEVNDVNRYIVGAFNTFEKKVTYLMSLKASIQAFANADDVAVFPALSVSRVVQDPPNGSNTSDTNERIGIGLIVGIVLAALAATCLVAAIIYSRRRRFSSNKTRSDSKGGSSNSVIRESPTAKARVGDYDEDGDSMYNLPINDTPTTCEESMYTSPTKGTLDYDLAGAFRDGGQHQPAASVGTSDSDFAAYIASFRNKSIPVQPPVPVCDDTESEFTGDGSETFNYSAAYKNIQGSIEDIQSQTMGHHGANDDLTIVDEFEVLAPPGNLGMVLQSASDGMPVVQEVYASSPLSSQVHVGDRLVSVDGRDVTMVMAVTVSRIIASKRENAVRRFVFARPMEI